MNAQTANSGPRTAALSPLELTGRARTHVRTVPELDCELHPTAAAALVAMRSAAAHDGIDLQPVSGFRDFERQLAIWNSKFRGERALLDTDHQPLRAADLNEAQRVAAILVWSALPGASRHHWGSDCDLIDGRNVTTGARVELLGADYIAGGRFERLSHWLMVHAHDYGFFLPYDRDRGGVQPEPWHLSFAPVAEAALAALNVELLRAALAGANLDGGAIVAAQLPQLHERYVAAVATAPAAALAAAALSRGATPA